MSSFLHPEFYQQLDSAYQPLQFEYQWPDMRPTVLKVLWHEPVTRSEWQDLFCSVHSVCLWDEKGANKVHQALQEEILDFIKQAQATVLSNEEDSALLKAYNVEWGKFFTQCDYLPKPFGQLETAILANKAHSTMSKKNQGDESIVRKLMLDSWNQSIFSNIKHRLQVSAMKLVHAERNGEAFDSQLVIGVRESYVNLSSDADDKLKIYRDNFEKAYLNATETFYKAKSPEYLIKNGVQNYMKYAKAKLKEEEQRAMRYLETRKGCKSVMALTMCCVNKCVTEYAYMIKNNETQKLRLMFSLLDRVSGGILQTILRDLEHHIQTQGLDNMHASADTITVVMESLGTETVRPSSASQFVAYIACAELVSTWTDLIQLLTQNVTNPASTEVKKESSLEAIGYICQEIEPEILQPQSNEILTAVVHCMKKAEPSNHVRQVATNALLNSLGFTKANFDIESERHFIMKVVCEATQSSDTQVRVAALQCLVKVMSLYYQYMEHYMRPLFGITMEGMKSDIDEVGLQGIEFWSSVCVEEMDLAIEASEARETGRPPERTSRFYAKGALQYLVPIITQCLAKQEEYDEWNPCKAAGVCLRLMATCCGDDIVPHVLPFVKEHIKSPDWRFRDAAVMAFGSLLDGPNPEILKPIVEQAMPMLIELLKDVSVVVRDTAAWSVGRVCEILPEAVINEQYLSPLLHALVEGLTSEPRVAATVCRAFSSLGKAAYEAADIADDQTKPATYSLSSYFEPIVQKLLDTTDRTDGNQQNLRSAAYEALMEMIKNSPKDCCATVQKTTLIILERLERVLQMEVVMGRADTCGVRLTESAAISRRHAKLQKKQQLWNITDLINLTQVTRGNRTWQQNVYSVIKEMQKRLMENVEQGKLIREVQKLMTDQHQRFMIELEHQAQEKESEKRQMEEKMKSESEKVKSHHQEQLDELRRIHAEEEKQHSQQLSEVRHVMEQNTDALREEKDGVIENVQAVMENKLTCAICNELFIRATSLNCSHIFCEFCIGQWLERKNECPQCRRNVTSKIRLLVLDNYIDHVTESLSDELKQRRQTLLEERRVEVAEHEARRPGAAAGLRQQLQFPVMQ